MIAWLKKLFRIKPKPYIPQPLHPGIYYCEVWLTLKDEKGWRKAGKTIPVTGDDTYIGDLQKQFMSGVMADINEKTTWFEDLVIRKVDPTFYKV
jgi:hypothetical protein